MRSILTDQADKQCRCGHSREHRMVSLQAKYSFWNMVWLLFGASVTPRGISWVCRLCSEVIDKTDDPEQIEMHYDH